MSLAKETRQQWNEGTLTIPEALYLLGLGLPEGDDRDLLIDLAVAAERQSELAPDDRGPAPVAASLPAVEEGDRAAVFLDPHGLT